MDTFPPDHHPQQHALGGYSIMKNIADVISEGLRMEGSKQRQINNCHQERRHEETEELLHKNPILTSLIFHRGLCLGGYKCPYCGDGGRKIPVLKKHDAKTVLIHTLWA
ncbi:MAG: hypothetical protein ACMUIL_14580 [bacterium]